MRRSLTVLAAAMVALAGGAVAQAHDADPSRPGAQAHDVGPFRVDDEVLADLDEGTTTGRYTVTPPAADQRRTHVYLALPDCGHEILTISGDGTIDPDGDPRTGTPGPAIRWKGKHRTTEPVTYWYRVRGAYHPENARMGIRSGDAYGGDVQRPSCEPWTMNDDNHEAPSDGEGLCRTALSVSNDSDVVTTMVPPGSSGLRVRFLHHCPAGSASTTTHGWKVTVDGHAVAVLRTRSESDAGGERRVEYELHLPVRAVEQVCLRHANQPEVDVCAPPS